MLTIQPSTEPEPMTSKAATEFDRRIGARITILRKAKSLSQRALGAALGVSQQQIQKYEKGSDRLLVSRLSEIAKCLDLPISVLLGEDTDMSEGHCSSALLRLPGATNLLKAFVAIENVELSRDILALAHTVARVSARPVTESA